MDKDKVSLESDLKEEVHIQVPYGMAKFEHMIGKLYKAIYGHKVAVRAWNRTSNAVFLQIDFRAVEQISAFTSGARMDTTSKYAYTSMT